MYTYVRYRYGFLYANVPRYVDRRLSRDTSCELCVLDKNSCLKKHLQVYRVTVTGR